MSSASASASHSSPAKPAKDESGDVTKENEEAAHSGHHWFSKKSHNLPTRTDADGSTDEKGMGMIPLNGTATRSKGVTPGIPPKSGTASATATPASAPPMSTSTAASGGMAREGEDVLQRRATVTFGQMHEIDPMADVMPVTEATGMEAEMGRITSHQSGRARGVTVAAPRITALPHAEADRGKGDGDGKA